MHSNDKIKTIQLDNTFHHTLINLSNNEELQRILHDLKVKIQRIEIFYFSFEESKQQSYNEHKQLIKALKNKDLVLAKQKLRENWENSLQRLQTKKLNCLESVLNQWEKHCLSLAFAY